MFDGPEFTTAVEALLYFFRNEHDAVFLAQFIQFFHKDFMCRQQTSVTLDRFDDNSCYFFGIQICFKCSFQVSYTFSFTSCIFDCFIIEGEAVDIRQCRAHFRTHLCCYHGHGHGTVCGTVVTIDECDDFGTFCISTAEFYCCIVGIGTTVTESNFYRYFTGIYGSQSFCIFNCRSAICINDCILRIFIQLFFYSIHNDRITATQVQRGCAGQEVNVRIAFYVINCVMINMVDCHREIRQMLTRCDYSFVSSHPGKICFFTHFLNTPILRYKTIFLLIVNCTKI